MNGYAIVSIAGFQRKVTPEAVVRVPRIEAEVGARISIDKVLVLSDGKDVVVGRPYLEGKSVEAEVVRHGLDRKVMIYKKKRRKNYRRKRGHRQGFTEIVIRALPA